VEFRHRSRSDKDIALPPQALIARNSVSEKSHPQSTAPLLTLKSRSANTANWLSPPGLRSWASLCRRRDRPDPATLIGKGKLQEISGAAASANADLILIDHELSASQQRNIENEVNARVIDRTQLILDIFARHARSREGQLQVELAQLEYLLPRLSGRGIEMSQARRRHRDPRTRRNTARNRSPQDLSPHTPHQGINWTRCGASARTSAKRRESVPLPTVALVGYTNAGKSTLFNALTDASVLVSSRMFATLDPTVRGATLPSKRKILLSDTVGFIRNLPTTLVDAFRATLEEVQRAALLLHVSDVTSPVAQEQQQQVDRVLKELHVQDIPQIRVMNKTDLLPEAQRRSLANGATVVYVSAGKRDGLEALLNTIDARLQIDAIQRLRIRVPQSEGKLLAEIEARAPHSQTRLSRQAPCRWKWMRRSRWRECWLAIRSGREQREKSRKTSESRKEKEYVV